MKFFLSILTLLTLFLISARTIFAFGYSRSNNKFGIHLAQPNLEDLEKAAEFINTNGGDWGYVTLVMQDNDRDKNKWQEVFDRMRELRLIPIIRLATHPQGAVWPAPSPDEAENWANFLNSLNWVVKDRYVILFNEPNHAGEWGGSVDARQYANIAKIYAEKLKEKNTDFFVMLAGLDASAPNLEPQFQDETSFLRTVFDNLTIEQFNNLFSGWISHSYPNPGFVGSPYESGRGTVRNYQWEMVVLRELGVMKDLPVFITETGWDGYSLSQDQVANNFSSAYQNIWLPDARVAAVTPFIFNYQSEPFARFSWLTPGGGGFYPVYFEIQNLAKRPGNPQIEDKGSLTFDFPSELVAHSTYRFSISLKNLGQAIWDKDRGYKLELEGLDPALYFFSDIKNIKPFQEESVDLFIKTNNLLGLHEVTPILVDGKNKIIERMNWKFEVVPLPSLTFKTSLYPKLKAQGNDFELQIFDLKQQLVFKKSGLEVKNQIGFVNEVQNIALGKKYRVVILKPYYLPRQEFITFLRGANQIVLKTMYPLDFNQDGKLSLDDLATFIRNPKLFWLFLP